MKKNSLKHVGTSVTTDKWMNKWRTFIKRNIPVFACAEELCTLVITEAFPEDSGLFKCVVLNSFGTVSCSAILDVYNGQTPLECCIMQWKWWCCFQKYWFVTLCRPGGAAGGGGSSAARGVFPGAGEAGGVPAGELHLQREQRGLSPGAAWLCDPAPSRVARQPSARYHPCCRVSDGAQYIEHSSTHVTLSTHYITLSTVNTVVCDDLGKLFYCTYYLTLYGQFQVLLSKDRTLVLVNNNSCHIYLLIISTHSLWILVIFSGCRYSQSMVQVLQLTRVQGRKYVQCRSPVQSPFDLNMHDFRLWEWCRKGKLYAENKFLALICCYEATAFISSYLFSDF